MLWNHIHYRLLRLSIKFYKYFDIKLVQFWDWDTPYMEILKGLDDLVKTGIQNFSMSIFKLTRL